jgi:hypothetical protein
MLMNADKLLAPDANQAKPVARGLVVLVFLVLFVVPDIVKDFFLSKQQYERLASALGTTPSGLNTLMSLWGVLGILFLLWAISRSTPDPRFAFVRQIQMWLSTMVDMVAIAVGVGLSFAGIAAALIALQLKPSDDPGVWIANVGLVGGMIGLAVGLPTALVRQKRRYPEMWSRL